MANPIEDLSLSRYYNVTIICSACSFLFPIIPEIEASLQSLYRGLPGLISMEVIAQPVFGELMKCPSCGARTIIRVTSTAIQA